MWNSCWRARHDGLLTSVVRSRLTLALYILLCGLTISPLLWASVPPLVDYPNHLARMWILVHGPHDPAISENYRVHWRLLPYLSMDLVVVALSWVMPVAVAGRIFVALTMLSLVGGTVVIRRALYQRVGLWPLISLLFVYNFVLFFGFLSCLFTIGLALIAFGGWISTRDWPLVPRLALFTVVSCLLVLSHLFGFGVYGLLVASYEAGGLLTRRISWGRLATAAARGLPFLLAIALALVAVAEGGPTHNEYGGLTAKLVAVFSPFNFSLIPQPLDLLMLLCSVAVLATLLLSRRLRVAPSMRLPLLALVVAAMAMPNWLSGAWGVDDRLPVTLPFVLIASSRLVPGQRGIRVGLGVLAGILLTVRVWTVSHAFADYDHWFWEFRRATAVIPPAARLLVVEAPVGAEAVPLPGVPDTLASVQPMVFTHMPALAVIDDHRRGAPQSDDRAGGGCSHDTLAIGRECRSRPSCRTRAASEQDRRAAILARLAC
jgi:hypothetical protein